MKNSTKLKTSLSEVETSKSPFLGACLIRIFALRGFARFWKLAHVQYVSVVKV